MPVHDPDRMLQVTAQMSMTAVAMMSPSCKNGTDQSEYSKSHIIYVTFLYAKQSQLCQGNRAARRKGCEIRVNRRQSGEGKPQGEGYLRGR